MQVKFSEDVVPLTDLKINPGKIVSQTLETHRPILLTSRGRGVAVMQSLAEFENNAEERAFLNAMAQGFADVQEGRTMTLDEARQRLGKH